MEIKKRILFISPDASRTGAPKTLLLFTKWLRENSPEIETTLLLLKDGELRSEFEKSVNEVILYPKLHTIPFFTEMDKKLRDFRFAKLYHRLKKQSYDFIYCNSVNTISVGLDIKKELDDPLLIAHIHELKTVIELIGNNFRENSSRVDLFLSASKMVENCLVSHYGISKEKVRTVYESSSISNPKEVHKREGSLQIGASGTYHWRKGGDVFIQVARYLKSEYPEIKFHFTWVGAMPHTERIIAQNDIEKLDLQDYVSFVGIKEKPEDYFREFDVFLLPSREDPFPLVCIEVGMLGIPIICFEKGTGISEILKDGGGVIVPYLNIKAMAEAIVNYYNKEEIRECHSREVSKLFSKFTPEYVCPQIIKIITEN